MKKYYTIGETAALLGVTTQTLRYYDKIGLLSPAYCDENTGYRYYVYKQFHYIDRIKYLQGFGMQLKDIKEIIHSGRVRRKNYMNKDYMNKDYMKNTFDNVMNKVKTMIVDGAMATELEAMGCDLNDELWSAKVLAEQPELIKKVHLSYFKAGADCGITASYQATIPGYMKKGYSEEEAEKLIVRSVELLQDAREEWWSTEGRNSGRVYPLIAAAVALMVHILPMVRNTEEIIIFPLKSLKNSIKNVWSCFGMQERRYLPLKQFRHLQRHLPLRKLLKKSVRSAG